MTNPRLLALAALILAPVASLACGVNLEANREAIERRWVASRPVTSPPAGPWAEWRASIRWGAERRACLANQAVLSWTCTEMLDCGLGMTSLGALCEAAGERHPADKVHAPPAKGAPCMHRIPLAFLDSMKREGYFTAPLTDPGQGAGSGENYALVQHERGTFCMVHGGPGAKAGTGARAQLAALGVTDPALLAMAWDRTPAGLPEHAWPLAILGLVTGFWLALRGRRAGPARASVRAALALALAAIVPPVSEACGLAPGSLVGAPGALVVALTGHAGATLVLAVLGLAGSAVRAVRARRSGCALCGAPQHAAEACGKRALA